MKVLLVKDVKIDPNGKISPSGTHRLGWLGDVIEVNDGYARNYLFAEGFAKVATEVNLRAIAKQKSKRAEQRIQEKGRLEQAAGAVEGAEAVIAAKANEAGVLFGSVTARAIAANLREQGFEVADSVVQLDEHIKQVGTHAVKLEFGEDLVATVSVVVVAEKGQEDEPVDKEPEG